MEKNKIKQFLTENWDMIKEKLFEEYDISDISFVTWIKPLKFHNFNNDTVQIVIPSDQAQAFNYISSKYKNYFIVTITEVIEYQVDVSFILEKDVDKVSVNAVVYNINSENANLNPKYRFESFIIGNSNRLAHSAALAVAESPGTEFNPLYLYGGSGLGKTHLMHSIGHFILDHNPNMKVLYVTAGNFTDEIVQAIRSGNTARMTEIREKYRSVDVLLIDDVQYLIGKEATQQEFFNTFNELHSAGKQIIISSDKPPKDLDTLEERFRTRFEWGLTADIQSPDYETRMAILKEYSKNTGKEIDEEVFEYISENITSNIRELEGAFNKLIAFSRLHKVQRIDMEVVEEALRNVISTNNDKEITPEYIISVVAEHFNLTSADILSKRRTQDLVLPRQICMYLCKEFTQESLQEIAKDLNKKDHTTVMNGIKKISDYIKVDNSLANKIETLKKILKP